VLYLVKFSFFLYYRFVELQIVAGYLPAHAS